MAKIQYANNLRDLAVAIGKSVPQLYEYRAMGCKITKTKRGYNVGRLRDWITKNIRQKAGSFAKGASNGAKQSKSVTDYAELYVQERALKTKAERERTELKHQIESGLYIPLEEVKTRDIERISIVKSGLMSLPRRLAQELYGLNANQMEVLIKTRFRELLERFSRM